MARRLIDFSGVTIDLDKIDYIEKRTDETYRCSYPYGLIVVYFDGRFFQKWWNSRIERNEWYEWLFKQLH